MNNDSQQIIMFVPLLHLGWCSPLVVVRGAALSAKLACVSSGDTPASAEGLGDWLATSGQHVVQKGQLVKKPPLSSETFSIHIVNHSQLDEIYL